MWRSVCFCKEPTLPLGRGLGDLERRRPPTMRAHLAGLMALVALVAVHAGAEDMDDDLAAFSKGLAEEREKKMENTLYEMSLTSAAAKRSREDAGLDDEPPKGGDGGKDE